jgi:hypothetical protein
MASLGKKILSAFMEVTEKETERTGDSGSKSMGGDPQAGGIAGTGPGIGSGTGMRPGVDTGAGAGRAADTRASAGAAVAAAAGADNRYVEYFDKLLSEANIPGPDYYEFARMVAAMQLIPDESARYHAAFAGLQVQGLNKDKLLSTAAEYLRVLTADSDHFQKTLEAALQDKVRGKETEAEAKAQRIQALSQEIMQLQQQIGALQDEVRVNRDKLTGSGSSYYAESQRRQQQIQSDIDKISQYI